MKNGFFNLRRIARLLAAFLAVAPTLNMAAPVSVAPVSASTVTEVLSQTNPDVNLIFEAAGYANITGLSSAQSQALINSLSSLFNTAYAVYQKMDINSGAQLTQIFNNYTASLKQAQTALAGLSAVSSASDVQNVINLISANNATSVMGTAVQLMAVVVYNYDHNKMFVQLTGANLIEPLTKLPMFTDKAPVGVNGYNESDYVVDFFVNMFANLASLLEQAYAAASSSLTPSQKANVTAINNAIAAINAAAVSLNNVVASTSKQISSDQAAYIAQMTTPANSVTAYNNGIAKISQDYAPLYGASGEVQAQIKAVAAAQQVVTTNLAQLGSALTTYQSQTINSNLAAANKTFTQALSTANTQFPSTLPSTLTYTTAQNYSTSVPGAAVIALYNQQQAASKPVTPNPSDLVTALNNAVSTATSTITTDQKTQIAAIDTAQGSQASLTAAINKVNADYKLIMASGAALPVALAAAQAAASLPANSSNAALKAAISAANTAFPPYPSVDLTVTTAAVAPYATSVPGIAIAAFQTEANKYASKGGGGMSAGDASAIALSILAVGAAVGIAAYLASRKSGKSVEESLTAAGLDPSDAQIISELSQRWTGDQNINWNDAQKFTSDVMASGGDPVKLQTAIDNLTAKYPSESFPDFSATAFLHGAADFYGVKNCGIQLTDKASLANFEGLVDSYSGVSGVESFSGQLTAAKTLLDPYITNGASGGRPNVADVLKWGNDTNSFGKGSANPNVEPGSIDAIELAGNALTSLRGAGARELSADAFAQKIKDLSATDFAQAVSEISGKVTPIVPEKPFNEGSGTESWAEGQPALSDLASIPVSDPAALKAQMEANLAGNSEAVTAIAEAVDVLERAAEDTSLTQAQRDKAQSELSTAEEVKDQIDAESGELAP